VYYPMGKALAAGITSASIAPELIAVEQTSGGSVDNLRALLAGEIEVGLVQADVAHRALHGEEPFKEIDGAAQVRAVASLYPERLQILTRRDAGIRRIQDFRGKSVSLDEAGSGTLAVMRIVLAAHGLGETDFDPVYLKPEFTQERLATGKLQGFSLMAGTPAKAIADIFGQDHFLVPVEPEIAARINHSYPYLAAGFIPEGAYQGVPQTPTLEVHALLVIREDMDEDLVYRMTAAIWSEQTQALLQEAHPQGRFVTLDSALSGVSIPLHPGARRFYDEQGLSTNGNLSP
jgi:TRAP transporter TAXI family solute receptor